MEKSNSLGIAQGLVHVISRILFWSSTILFITLNIFGCAGTQFTSSSSSSSSLDSLSDPDGDSDRKGFGYFPTTRPITGYRVVVFDPNYDAWAAYNEIGVLINAGKASGGRDYCPDVGRPCKTISGNFKILWKGDESCISHKYPLDTNGGAPMPYCMYFSSSGYAIHGSDDIPDYNASHGCIRVTPTAAKWLNENFVKIGTKLIVLPYSRFNYSGTAN